jgi:hypothetical protein
MPSLPADKGTTVQHGVSEAGAVFCPHPLCPPLPQAGEGECAVGRTAVRPYIPLLQAGEGERAVPSPASRRGD